MAPFVNLRLCDNRHSRMGSRLGEACTPHQVASIGLGVLMTHGLAQGKYSGG